MSATSHAKLFYRFIVCVECAIMLHAREVFKTNHCDVRVFKLQASSIHHVKAGAAPAITRGPWIVHDLELTSDQFSGIIDSAARK